MWGMEFRKKMYQIHIEIYFDRKRITKLAAPWTFYKIPLNSNLQSDNSRWLSTASFQKLNTNEAEENCILTHC